MGTVLHDVATLLRDKRWDRLKICADEACGAAFYDCTRSKTQRWHSFSICGNKNNVAAHRVRSGKGCKTKRRLADSTGPGRRGQPAAGGNIGAVKSISLFVARAPSRRGPPRISSGKPRDGGVASGAPGGGAFRRGGQLCGSGGNCPPSPRADPARSSQRERGLNKSAPGLQCAGSLLPVAAGTGLQALTPKVSSAATAAGIVRIRKQSRNARMDDCWLTLPASRVCARTLASGRV